MSGEDWAEIRRLHRVEGMAIKAIARRLGVSRNAVRRALARDAPPKYVRARKGSIVDAVEPQVRELLRAVWTGSPSKKPGCTGSWSRIGTASASVSNRNASTGVGCWGGCRTKDPGARRKRPGSRCGPRSGLGCRGTRLEGTTTRTRPLSAAPAPPVTCYADCSRGAPVADAVDAEAALVRFDLGAFPTTFLKPSSVLQSRTSFLMYASV